MWGCEGKGHSVPGPVTANENRQESNLLPRQGHCRSDPTCVIPSRPAPCTQRAHTRYPHGTRALGSPLACPVVPTPGHLLIALSCCAQMQQPLFCCQCGAAAPSEGPWHRDLRKAGWSGHLPLYTAANESGL